MSQWADKYRELSPEGSAKRGKFRTADVPYQEELMDAPLDPRVRSVCMMLASQLGKTETQNNTVGFFMDVQPSPVLMVQPTVELAEAWSKERFDPMVRDTPRLRDLVQPARSRDSGNTILRKTFPGGNIAIVGANAPSGLAGRPRRVVLLDEVDRFPVSAGEEGDPCSLAIRRTESFWNAVVVMTSTPTVRDRSRIESEFLQSDQRRWFCKCHACGGEQWLKWSQVQWPDNQPEEAVYVCEHCAATWTDAQRITAVKGGRWIATKPFNGRAGFHLNGINSLFRHKNGFKNRLHQMAEDFLAAKRLGREAMKTWTNTFLAETYGADADRVEPDPLLARRESYSTLPNDALLLTAGVDVQGDRLEATVYAWGDGEQSWCVAHRVISGRYDTEQPWKGLDLLLDEVWERDDGTELQIARCVVDSGAWQDHVLKQTKKRFARGVVAGKGANTPGLPVLGNESRANRSKAPQYRIGTDTAKGIIYSRLKLTEPGPGFMRFTNHPNGGQDKTFFDMLTAEEAQTRKVKGRSVIEWHKIRPRNEALDCCVMALAALYHLKPNWRKLTGRPAVVKEGKKAASSTAINLSPVVSAPEGPKPAHALTYELRKPPEPDRPAEPLPGTPAVAPAAAPSQPRRFGRFRRRGPGWTI